jgi:hypothetical protein
VTCVYAHPQAIETRNRKPTNRTIRLRLAYDVKAPRQQRPTRPQLKKHPTLFHLSTGGRGTRSERYNVAAAFCFWRHGSTELRIFQHPLSQLSLLTSLMPRESAISQLRTQLERLSNPEEIIMGYSAWAFDHFDFHDELRFGALNLCFRCTNETCIHYICGFSTSEELGKHLDVHCSQRPSALPLSIKRIMLHRTRLPKLPRTIVDDSALDADSMPPPLRNAKLKSS